MLRNFKKLSTRNLALALTVILLVVAGIFFWQHHRRLKNPIISSTNPLASSPKGNSVSSGNQTAQANQTANTSATQTASGPAPTVPYGDFVSNHHPGGSAPTTEASTCNTTPGATCYIELINGSITKKLNTETTDSRGSAIWYWDVKTAGLTSGSWTVTAVATLNGQTKSASDSLPLVIQ